MLVSTTLAGPGAEDTIVDALRSAYLHVDKCLVILSGADESAVRSAALDALGPDAPHTVAFSRLEWPGDYGIARTWALDEAGKVGAEWALTLDCDERLEIGPDTLAALKPEFDVVTVLDRDTGANKPRFLRCGAGIEWRGRVHEKLFGARMPFALAPGAFWELPKSLDALRRREQRAIDWHRDEPAVVEGDPHWRQHLAECLLRFERFDEGRGHFEAVAAMAELHHDEAAWVQYRLAQLDVMRGDLDGAWKRALAALGDNPSYIHELGHILAHISATRGYAKRAALWASMAIETPMDPFRFGHRSPTCRAQCETLLAQLTGHQHDTAPSA